MDNTRVQDILTATFPFFALVLCGWLATRWRMLPLEAIAGLNTFVLYFALPCMLYRFGASTPIAQLLDPAPVDGDGAGGGTAQREHVVVLAERFGADNGRIARVVLLTTAVAFFTFSSAVALLH